MSTATASPGAKHLHFDENDPFATTTLAGKLKGTMTWDPRGGVELSPLHDVYMSSPMSVRMKRFDQGQAMLKEKHMKETYYDADMMDAVAQRPQTSPGRMGVSKLPHDSQQSAGPNQDLRDKETEELRLQCSILANRLRELERDQKKRQQDGAAGRLSQQTSLKSPHANITVSPPRSTPSQGGRIQSQPQTLPVFQSRRFQTTQLRALKKRRLRSHSLFVRLTVHWVCLMVSLQPRTLALEWPCVHELLQ